MPYSFADFRSEPVSAPTKLFIKNILELFEDIYIKNEMGKMGIILNDMKQRGYYGYGYRYYNAGYTYRYGYYSAYNDYVEGDGKKG